MVIGGTSLFGGRGAVVGSLFGACIVQVFDNGLSLAGINATLLALVRNEELGDMISSMRDLERTWNSKFNYPWTFFNDVPFTDDFIRLTRAATNATCNYGRR